MLWVARRRTGTGGVGRVVTFVGRRFRRHGRSSATSSPDALAPLLGLGLTLAAALAAQGPVSSGRALGRRAWRARRRRGRTRIADVTPPPPVQQSIGNCWSFATKRLSSRCRLARLAPSPSTPRRRTSASYWLDRSAPPQPFTRGRFFYAPPHGLLGHAADLLTRFRLDERGEVPNGRVDGHLRDRHQAAFQTR